MNTIAWRFSDIDNRNASNEILCRHLLDLIIYPWARWVWMAAWAWSTTFPSRLGGHKEGVLALHYENVQILSW